MPFEHSLGNIYSNPVRLQDQDVTAATVTLLSINWFFNDASPLLLLVKVRGGLNLGAIELRMIFKA